MSKPLLNTKVAHAISKKASATLPTNADSDSWCKQDGTPTRRSCSEYTMYSSVKSLNHLLFTTASTR
jgi:hypothetical protein